MAQPGPDPARSTMTVSGPDPARSTMTIGAYVMPATTGWLLLNDPGVDAIDHLALNDSLTDQMLLDD